MFALLGCIEADRGSGLRRPLVCYPLPSLKVFPPPDVCGPQRCKIGLCGKYLVILLSQLAINTSGTAEFMTQRALCFATRRKSGSATDVETHLEGNRTILFIIHTNCCQQDELAVLPTRFWFLRCPLRCFSKQMRMTSD